MSISQAISKAQSTEGGSSKQQDKLESHVEALDFYGMVRPEGAPVSSGPKKRGRPPGSKSKSPARQEVPNEFPAASSTKATKKIDDILNKMNRARLLTKLRAYNAYWPDICPLSNVEMTGLSIEDMERLIEMFELSVNSFSEIIDIPQSIKGAIAKIEPLAIQTAITNPTHPWLSKGRYMTGFSQMIAMDPNIDRNVKLLSIRFLGKLPRNPVISLLYHIFGAALQTITINQARDAEANSLSEHYQSL